MLTSNINFISFNIKKKTKSIKLKLKSILKENNHIVQSLRRSYKDTYSRKTISIFRKKFDYRIIGMGGSILGAQAIYDFLKKKIKKKFYFIDNLKPIQKNKLNKNYNNIIISKSGNTIETIVNSNVLIKKKDVNLFITENKKSYLKELANKLKSEVIHHNNYIGGRYSVLSEVGMLPSELMGLKSTNFRQLNNLVKNKKYMDKLVQNVSAIIFYLRHKKFNSVIINYDENSSNLFYWYQQLVAESLGKKKERYFANCF